MTMQASPARIVGTYGYYRQPDGFITVSPATDTDELRYRRGGWEPLRQYGTFEMSTPYMASHPLEPLFMAGGAHELTVEQIRQQGLHLQTIYVPSCKTPLGAEHKRHTRGCLTNQLRVTFPQLAAMTDLGAFPCQMPGCQRPPFPTREARDQHEGVMHKPEKSDERTGQSLAAALIQGFGGHSPVPLVAVPAPALVAVPVEAPNAPDPALTAIMAELAALRAKLAAIEQATAAVPVPASAPTPVAPVPVVSQRAQPLRQVGNGRALTTAEKRAQYDRNGTKHTHAAPFGGMHLVDGCPRCEELRQQMGK